MPSFSRQPLPFFLLVINNVNRRRHQKMSSSAANLAERPASANPRALPTATAKKRKLSTVLDNDDDDENDDTPLSPAVKNERNMSWTTETRLDLALRMLCVITASDKKDKARLNHGEMATVRATYALEDPDTLPSVNTLSKQWKTLRELDPKLAPYFGSTDKLKQLTQSVAESDKKRQEEKAAAKEVQELQEKLAAKNKELSDTKSRLAESESAKDDLNKQLEEANARIAELLPQPFDDEEPLLMPQ
ncbi:hypothetical protein HRR83_005854 [Exophiala dermatitidis]|uniref:Uncharacterized protein n=2 Tax=Exophiala dermatitidis TaxID=5970 RepID=H6BUL3_EXODN|nr:uncharacterized protein HMPREF1120_03048 [Exophiala dermatitidis NIH/UT8656]XP_009155349.1 hypothetical protein, variant [Exophiala dermatitidis NIH/UT8656]KAJ4508762.1 hypothetical protein HRR73_007431 [Exophiala dermatitidis]EHY54887.1 hypothetical protein, variant [Exophiala dermatitidis NIH/UT8656]EHY54888.1 hypothetical protein HMPREF1120_03048 [Exophiala dermatitidis NIH/UT8656]KAJ4513409.1 hypothetical protein HRR74_006223 [Exophiala dermatitidis]KAJ4538036.1 hypothetical protein HR